MNDAESGVLRYHERSLAHVDDPLAAAVTLAARERAADLVVYERDGEWSVAVGAVAEIWIDRAGIHRTVEGVHERIAPLRTSSQALTVVASALSRLSIANWRAYGIACFELACIDLRSAQELPATGGLPLLHLRIPRVEVRLRNGSGLVRAVDVAALRAVADLLQAPPARLVGRPLPIDERCDDADGYRALVARAVRSIRARELQKVIVSRRLAVEAPVDLLASYALGRHENQPARSFVVRHGDFAVAGFSPETVAEVSAAGTVSTQPLAGTRHLSSDEAENESLVADLYSDDKEIAEHATSVKLACQEMRSVCTPESVRVEEFMEIARRGSVQHLASRVVGQLAAGRGPWDAFHALFPAVTASGIPKAPALEFIRRHEPRPRGLYSGAVLVADADGSLDAALVLRSLFQQGRDTWLHAGAGIVARSTPEREFEETCEKLRSVSRYLVPLHR